MYNDDIKYDVDKHGDKIKKILEEKLFVSKRLIKKLKDANNIYLNGKEENLDKNTYIGDIVEIKFQEEENIYESNYMDLDVLYEDEDFLGINKSAGVIMHPSKEKRTDTLANGLVYYFQKNNIKRKIRFINRLDMNTSGVVVIAKNPFAQAHLMKEMKKNNLTKTYLAIVQGYLKPEEGIIDAPVGLANNEKIKRQVTEEGQYAITKYYTKEKYNNNLSLIELNLLTGRTHQIRVHLAYIGHPVIGDELYGKKSRLIMRQALHCSEMRFKSFRNNEIISIKAPLPKDFLAILEEKK